MLLQVARRTISQSQGLCPGLRDPGLWFVLITLAVTTVLHYLTDIHLIPYHSIYRSLYYLPIAVAAVRYGRRGGVLTALTASMLYIPHAEQHLPPQVLLTITDTGHRIAPADLPHIFDPFFTTRVDGTGLGLSIVQQIIQEHGGTVEVHSQMECGATFVVSLPVLPHS